jgi:Holliday junction resolvase RusA-like endonuclease
MPTTEEFGMPAGFPACFIAGAAVSFSLFVAGTPVPKGRPRTRVVQPKESGAKAWAQIYSPHETVGWEEMVIVQVRQQLVGLQLTEPRLSQLEMPLSGRGLLSMRFNLPRPKSLPKRVQFPMKSKSDWDNLAKSVQDALQLAGLILNDAMITDGSAAKRFAAPGHPVGVEIDLTVMP